MLTPQEIQSVASKNGDTVISNGIGQGKSNWLDSFNSAVKPPANDTLATGGISGMIKGLKANPLINSIGDTFAKGGAAVTSDIQNTNKNANADIGTKLLGGAQAAGHIAGDIAGTAGGLIGDVVAPLIPKAVQSKIGDVAGYINQKIDAIPGMTPELHHSIADVFNTLTLKGGEAAEPTVTNAVKVVTPKIGEVAENVINKVGTVGKKLGNEDLVSSATKQITPDIESLTATQQSKLAGQTAGKGIPRINEGGLIKGRTVNLTPQETAAATELSKVPGYSGKLSNLETHNLIKDSISNEAESMRASLRTEKITVPKKQITSTIQKAVDSATKDSLLLSKSDPMIANYMRVAKTATTKASGNLEGVLDVRQALDDAYYNARGKMAYGDTRINTLDEIHQAARTELNKMLGRAKNTDVVASLKKQTNLYRADDNILPKVGKEAGSKIGRSKIVQAAKKHPYITGAVTAGVSDKVLKATTGFGI